MEKDDQEQAAMELAETGGALGLEVPESMEISIDEIALPELAHLGTMELLLQACANHLYSLDRMQTAWMSAMLVAELPHFSIGGGGGEGGEKDLGSSITDGLSNASSIVSLLSLFGKTIGSLTLPQVAGVTFLGTILLDRLFSGDGKEGKDKSNGEESIQGFENLQETLLYELAKGETFGETFSEQWHAKMGVVPQQMLPWEYQKYGYDYTTKKDLTEEQKQKAEEILEMSKSEIDAYIADRIKEATEWRRWGPEDEDPTYEFKKMLEIGPYQTEQLDVPLETQSKQLSAVQPERTTNISITCNFDEWKFTKDDIKALSAQLAADLSEEISSAGMEIASC